MMKRVLGNDFKTIFYVLLILILVLSIIITHVRAQSYYRDELKKTTYTIPSLSNSLFSGRAMYLENYTSNCNLPRVPSKSVIEVYEITIDTSGNILSERTKILKEIKYRVKNLLCTYRYGNLTILIPNIDFSKVKEASWAIRIIENNGKGIKLDEIREKAQTITSEIRPWSKLVLVRDPHYVTIISIDVKYNDGNVDDFISIHVGNRVSYIG